MTRSCWAARLLPPPSGSPACRLSPVGPSDTKSSATTWPATRGLVGRNWRPHLRGRSTGLAAFPHAALPAVDQLGPNHVTGPRILWLGPPPAPGRPRGLGRTG